MDRELQNGEAIIDTLIDDPGVRKQPALHVLGTSLVFLSSWFPKIERSCLWVENRTFARGRNIKI